MPSVHLSQPFKWCNDVDCRNMDDFYNCTELMHEGINCQCYFPGARYRGLIPEMDHFHLGLLYDMIVVSICPRTFCSDNVHSEHFIINTMNIGIVNHTGFFTLIGV